MANLAARIRNTLFGLSPEEVAFSRRGFHFRDPSRRDHLEASGGGFVDGFNLALAETRAEPLSRSLDRLEPRFQGFAYEGAAMALKLLDLLTPWNRGRFEAFIRGPADPHLYMAYVGAGWAMARLTRRFQKGMRAFDPLLGWLAVDGYGFHEGFFHTERAYARKTRPRNLSGYALRVFDQGLGRAMWFTQGADVAAIAAAVASFPPERREDLWSGVGLACAYAGGASTEDIRALQKEAGEHALWLAQGAAFAAKARLRAGNPAPYNELAVHVLSGKTLADAARMTDDALQNLPADRDGEPAFAVWRSRLHAMFAEQARAA